MALRLDGLVLCGELRNTRKNSTHGWLGLRGFDRPLVFELTGDCDPDLAGRYIRFEVRDPPRHGDNASDTDESEDAKLERLRLSGLKWQQIGPTGTMTAARKVRVADCSTEELLFRCKHDEPPPMEWKRCLYLEWFSQNGRVVLELADPIIEFIEPNGEPPAGPEDAAIDESPEESPPSAEEGGLGITSFHLNEDGEVEITDEMASPGCDDEACEGCNDPYRLIPNELQRQLDAESDEADRNLYGEDDEGDINGELELMDELIDRGEGEPIGMLFDGPVRLPSPDSLDDVQVERELKGLLARLALCGIALHMCEHYTPRQAYRLLIEHLCMEEKGYAELRPTQWVQHFLTSEYCEACQAEDARAFEEEQRRKSSPSEGDADSDADGGD